MQEWTTDALWTKAKSYCDKAFSLDPADALFPLIASFALELLGKAALAKIHPVLIADPRGDSGQNILYAFEIPTKAPTTIAAKTVFSRLTQLVPDFTEEDQAACAALADRRNKDLHAGELAFDGYTTGQWLPDFYRVVRVLCEFLGRDVAELLGNERGAEAKEATAHQKGEIEGRVADKVRVAKAVVSELDADQLAAKRKSDQASPAWTYRDGKEFAPRACPVCESRGSLLLRHVSDRPPQIDGDQVSTEAIYSPRSFECGTCGFNAHGTPELRVVGLADQVKRTDEISAIDYFELAREEWDGDYGND